MRLPDHHAALGVYVVSIAAAMDIVVLWHGFPTGIDGNVAGVVLGAWNALAATVVNFVYGSSRQSEKLSDQVASATPAATPNVAQAAANAGTTDQTGTPRA